MTAIMNLTADLLGQTIGNLFDPFLWVAMIAAAFRVRMRWILPVAVVVAAAFEAVMYFTEPPELQAYRFAAYTLIGRTLAGWLIGSGARFFITRRRRAQATRPPVVTAAP